MPIKSVMCISLFHSSKDDKFRTYCNFAYLRVFRFTGAVKHVFQSRRLQKAEQLIFSVYHPCNCLVALWIIGNSKQLWFLELGIG